MLQDQHGQPVGEVVALAQRLFQLQVAGGVDGRLSKVGQGRQQLLETLIEIELRAGFIQLTQPGLHVLPVQPPPFHLFRGEGGSEQLFLLAPQLGFLQRLAVEYGLVFHLGEDHGDRVGVDFHFRRRGEHFRRDHGAQQHPVLVAAIGDCLDFVQVLQGVDLIDLLGQDSVGRGHLDDELVIQRSLSCAGLALVEPKGKVAGLEQHGAVEGHLHGKLADTVFHHAFQLPCTQGAQAVGHMHHRVGARCFHQAAAIERFPGVQVAEKFALPVLQIQHIAVRIALLVPPRCQFEEIHRIELMNGEMDDLPGQHIRAGVTLGIDPRPQRGAGKVVLVQDGELVGVLVGKHQSPVFAEGEGIVGAPKADLFQIPVQLRAVIQYDLDLVGARLGAVHEGGRDQLAAEDALVQHHGQLQRGILVDEAGCRHCGHCPEQPQQRQSGAAEYPSANHGYPNDPGYGAFSPSTVFPPSTISTSMPDFCR